MNMSKYLSRTAMGMLMACAVALPAAAADLRIGLQDDADTLDPTQSRTFAGRLVYTSLCDKLVDLDDAVDDAL